MNLRYNLTKLLQSLLPNTNGMLCTASITYSTERQRIEQVVNSAALGTIELFIRHNTISGYFLNVFNKKNPRYLYKKCLGNIVTLITALKKDKILWVFLKFPTICYRPRTNPVQASFSRRGNVTANQQKLQFEATLYLKQKKPLKPPIRTTHQ